MVPRLAAPRFPLPSSSSHCVCVLFFVCLSLSSWTTHPSSRRWLWSRCRRPTCCRCTQAWSLTRWQMASWWTRPCMLWKSHLCWSEGSTSQVLAVFPFGSKSISFHTFNKIQAMQCWNACALWKSPVCVLTCRTRKLTRKLVNLFACYK